MSNLVQEIVLGKSKRKELTGLTQESEDPRQAEIGTDNQTKVDIIRHR